MRFSNDTNNRILMKIYITGSSGRVGKVVMKMIPKVIPVNLRDKTIDLKKALNDATHVIHLAASLKFNDRKELWNTNYELTKKVVEATPKNARIIYASSIAVYGKKLAEIPASEKTECNPNTDYGKAKYEGEKEVMKRDNSISLRIAVVYGPNFDDYYKMMSALKKEKIPIIGDGKNHIPFVHVEDVAQAIKNSLDAKPGIYLISGESIAQKELIEFVCNELNVNPPKRRIPKFLIGPLFSIKMMISSGKSLDFLTKEHLDILMHNRIFDSSKAKKELGFSPRPVKEGIKQMVDEYKNNLKYARTEA